jgi:hypothetical protein
MLQRPSAITATGTGTLTPAIVGAAFLDTLIEHVLINFLVDDERGATTTSAPSVDGHLW